MERQDPVVQAHGGGGYRSRPARSRHGANGRLAVREAPLHHESMGDDEATHLMLEALCDIRAKVDEIHAIVVEEDDDEETEKDA